MHAITEKVEALVRAFDGWCGIPTAETMGRISRGLFALVGNPPAGDPRDALVKAAVGTNRETNLLKTIQEEL